MKLSADVIDKHLTNVINANLESSYFSENAKITSVKPIYKKESRSDENNYRPVSILNCFSKIFERFINDKLLSHVNDTLSDFVSAYRSNYSSDHMILRVIEEWKEKLHKGFFAGAVLNGLVKGVWLHTSWFVNCKINCARFWQKVPRILLFLFKTEETIH